VDGGPKGKGGDEEESRWGQSVREECGAGRAEECCTVHERE